MRYTDRSRHVEGMQCKRSRYWAYEYEGRGIERKGKGEDLIIGLMVHEAAEIMLACAVGGLEYDTKAVADRVLGRFWLEHSGDLYFRKPRKDRSRGLDEISALIEAQIWVLGLRAVPRLLEEYEILDVEREEEEEVAPELTLMGRADGVLRHRESGDIFILSLKTAGSWNYSKAEEIQVDDQGLSEQILIANRFRREGREDLAERIQGIQYLFMLKGELKNRAKSEESDNPFAGWGGGAGEKDYYYSNFLIHPWESNKTGEFFWKWSWRDINGDRRQLNWREHKQVDVWQDPGVGKWIERLARGEVQEHIIEDALDYAYILPTAVKRHESEREGWLRQLVAQEEFYAYAAEMESPNRFDTYESYLDTFYPQNRSICTSRYGVKCKFFDLCHGVHRNSPDMDEQWQFRAGNHPAEREGWDGEQEA